LVCLLGCVKPQVTHIPVTLERGVYSSVNTDQVDLYIVKPCEDSCADNGFATMSIALPENPTWNTSMPLVTVELSTCQYTFDSTCVFSTNYIWSSLDFFPQIVWEWPAKLDSQGYFYIRVTAQTRAIPYSFDIAFSITGSITGGVYNFNAFKNSVVSSGSTFNQLTQYINLPQPGEVKNYGYQTYFVKFCADDFPKGCGCYNDFTVIATVTATADRPMSAFNLFACQYDAQNAQNCGSYNYQLSNTISASVVQMTIHSQSFNASLGIYYSIQGVGGESDGMNSYYFNLKLYFQ